MLHDLRFALRLLRRSPGFAAVAVLVLALGIGANTAIFSLVYAVLLQPPPFPHPGRLVELYETEQAPGNYPLSGPDFPDWKAQSRLFAGMALLDYPRSYNLGGLGQPQRVLGEPVEDNYFRLLGVPAERGRMFAAGESRPGHDHVVVLAHSLWQSRFGGDPAAIGRTITLNREAYTIIGVAPPSFHLQSHLGLWTALNLDPKALGQRGDHSYGALGRLKPGVTLAQARQELSAIAARLARQYPASNASTGARVFPLRDRLVGASRASLLTLMAVVGLVLLIACANLANLLLARALGRQKEMSIRLALGARRGHIVRQLLTESVLLSLLGALLGAALAAVAVRAAVALPAFPLPRFNPIQVNGAVLAFTIALAVACGLLFGLAPALRLSRPRLNHELSGAGALAGGGRRRWLSDGLIIAEVALSLLLLAAAGLFLQSFARLRSRPLGLNPNHLLTAAVTLPAASYPSSSAVAPFQRTLLARVQAIPGVQAAALSSELPLEGGSNGYVSLPGESGVRHSLVEWTYISPSYFAALQIPLLAGRGYTPAEAQAWDRAAALLDAPTPPPPATLNSLSLPVVVNQALARHFFPNQSPLGRRFRQGDDGPWMTVIGVVRDVPIFGLDAAPMAQAYFPTTALVNSVHLELRSALPQAALAASLRRVLAGLDATLPLYNLRTMDQVADQSVSSQALQQGLVAAFALLALLLAAAGLYGVMSYLVVARTREIGVRMALGASRAAVMRLVVGRGIALAATGIVLGTLAALAAGQLIASQLYQVRPGNPLTLLAAAAVLLAASFAACYLPARRAASVNPIAALRTP